MRGNISGVGRFAFCMAMICLISLERSAAERVKEAAKSVPVVYDVDVAVAGGGLSGVFAAIAAARNGAQTVLIERFSSVGGISGPGMNTEGGDQIPGDGPLKTKVFRDLAETGQGTKKGEFVRVWIYPEIAGIPKEFALELESLASGDNELEKSAAIVYLATKMLKEAGVHLLLSTLVTDPILEGNVVKGVFVENKSGRQAVKSKVVIDATGEADVARRAGAPILYPKEEYYKLDTAAPNGMGVSFFIGGVNWAKYDEALKKGDRQAELKYPPLRIGKKGLLKYSTQLGKVKQGETIAAMSIGVRSVTEEQGGSQFPEDLSPGSGLDMSLVERETRLYVFELVQQIKKQLPGCESAYLIEIAPFFGARGGPAIEGEYIFTPEDFEKESRFEDVVYLYASPKPLQVACIERGKCVWPDLPYRVLIPKKIDGLLAVGRSASGIPDTILRNRTGVQHMGQVGGIAAAMAAKQGISPRRVNVKELQRKLLQAGFYLGDDARLKELGLKE